MKTVEEYELELKQLENYIQEIWAFGKRSKAKERRIEEIKLILIGMETKQLLNKKDEEIRTYKRLLKQHNIAFEETL